MKIQGGSANRFSFLYHHGLVTTKGFLASALWQDLSVGHLVGYKEKHSPQDYCRQTFTTLCAETQLSTNGGLFVPWNLPTGVPSSAQMPPARPHAMMGTS